MARRGSRTWDTNVSRIPVGGGSLSRLETASLQLFSNAENGIMPLGGGFKLTRMMGALNLVVRDFVVGLYEPTLWHGVLLVDDEVTVPADGTGVEIIETLEEDANLGSWLWREPIPWMKTSFASDSNTVYWCQQFDWQFRGGRGSTVQVGQRVMYLLQHVGIEAANTAFVQGELSYLALFGT